MAKYSNTKAKINEKIATNGRQAVTGAILNDVLQTMVDSLGADYQFGGLVQPGSSFTAGEQPVVFLATTPGTYTNFGGLVVADGEVALLVWSGTAWNKQTPDIATRTEVSQLGQKVTEDYGDFRPSNEFIRVYTDSEGKVLEGTKNDGSKVINGDMAVKGNVEVEDDIVLSGVRYKVVNSGEWKIAFLDEENKVLFGVRQDGTTFVGDAEFLQILKENNEKLEKYPEYYSAESSEWFDVVLDSEGKVLEGRRKDGTKYYYGIEQILSRLGVLENPYEQILISERNNTLKKWIPYYKGSPSTEFGVDDSYDRCNLLFFTDSHIDWGLGRKTIGGVGYNNASLENLNDTIEFANGCPVHIDAVLQGGDNITPFDVVLHDDAYNLAELYYENLKKCNVPICFIRGNHDNNDWRNYPANVLTNTDFNNLWYDYAEQRFGIVRQTRSDGVKSMYHYYDITDKKIRVIAVDVEDIDRVTVNESGFCKFYGTTMNYIANEQLNWIANTALMGLQDGWGVVFVMHQSIILESLRLGNPPTWYASRSQYISPNIESSIQKLFLIAKAFNSQGTYSNTYTYSGEQHDGFYNLNVSADFSSYSSMTNKPHIICWLMGHEHEDYHYVLDGINFIWTAQAACMMGASDDRVVRMEKTPNQNCFDIINIDTVHRKIRIFRYGAGVSCYGEGGDRFLTEGISY